MPHQPPIRPLPDQPPVARPGWGPWLAIAAGVVGLTVGVAVGAGIGSDPDVPPTTGVTLSSLPPDLAAPGFVEPTTTTTTTTTLPPPTTTSTTRADPAPPPTLGEMVPGLDGTLLIPQELAGEVLRWRVGDAAPDRFPLPPGTDEVRFDASADWTAALQTVFDSIRPGTLYLAGRDMEFQPFDTGVTDFDWHPTVSRRLAWVRTTLDGKLELWSGEVPGPAEELRRVAGLGPPAEGEQLVLRAWGDWGFAFPRFRLGGEQALFTMDPAGRIVAEREAAFVAASPDGTLAIKPLPIAGDPQFGAVFTDLAMEDLEPIDWPISLEAMWSADGARLASVSFEGVGAVLRVRGGGSFQQVLDAEWAVPVAWSPGNRFVVSYSGGVRTRFSSVPDDTARDGEVRRPALVFTDAADRSTSAIAVRSPMTEIAFRVAS